MTWLVHGARKDRQSITADWRPVGATLIAGVAVKEVATVLKDSGALTEVYRADWELDDLPVDQVFQVRLAPGEVSGWHAHEFTTDRLFVTAGQAKIVLYDGRQDSPTFGLVNEFRLGAARAGLVVIPPKVWHAVQALPPEPAVMLNLVDRAYEYEDPDHWRVAADTPHIPYSFQPRPPARPGNIRVRPSRRQRIPSPTPATTEL
jgi:dTDP-4-dehydrorhamnose 3,5-epimerase